MKKVLVFPCGSELGLELYRAVKYNKDYELIGASSVDDHGKFVYEKYYENLPMLDDKNLIKEINLLIKKEKIDFIYPAHDSAVLEFSKNRKKLNAAVVTSDFFTCDICRSKRKTYEFFKDLILVPEMYDAKKIKSKDFPLFLKPDVGQGSKGTQKLNNMADFKYYYKDSSQLLLEYLPYDEYTIDCFTNFNGELLYVSGRKRNRILNGISVGIINEENSEFSRIANIINENLKFNGAWFFQLKKNRNNELCLLEIAPRIAGTMEYQRSFGVNLPLLSIYNADNIPVDIIKNNYNVDMDRALYSEFKIDYDFNNVYIDLDDVIIQNDKINYMIIAFLYKCINNNVKIILITRHKKDVMESLKSHHIDCSLFEDIIHIKDDTSKSKYIKNSKSIYIDDSHKERKDVYQVCKIPVFDTNMIDILI